MEIVHEQRDLERYMREAVKVSNDSPVLLDRFLNDAIEVDVDALADDNPNGKDVVIEHHGAHRAGRRAFGRFGMLAASLFAFPGAARRAAQADGCDARPQRRRPDERAVRDSVSERQRRPGLVYVLEVNPRASRTVPYVSKATGRRLPRSPRAAWSVRRWPARVHRRSRAPVFLGQEAVFPFIKFPGVDTILDRR